MTNPKSNMQKDPDDWVSGDEPMTGAQTSYLKTLSEQAHEPDAFDGQLTEAEASKETACKVPTSNASSLPQMSGKENMANVIRAGRHRRTMCEVSLSSDL